MTVPSEFKKFELCNIKFEEYDEIRELGVNLCMNRNIPGASKIIDKIENWYTMLFLNFKFLNKCNSMIIDTSASISQLRFLRMK